MKTVGKILLVIVGLFAALMIAQLVASESGEVVVVSTNNADGGVETTRLWVVDHEGSQWLRSGSPMAGWYQRMTASPEIQIERAGITYAATVQPDVAKRDVINSLMREKYGWADQFIELMFGRDDAIAIEVVVADS